MQTFRSVQLQKNLRMVQDAARREPVLFTHHGQPNVVLMSVEEFQRLKAAAGEPVPPEILRRHALTQTGLAPDPLGYDTSDLATCALEMAAAALSGRNRDAVAKEIEQVERRFGFSSARAPGSAATDGWNRGDADLNCTSRSPPTQEFG